MTNHAFLITALEAHAAVLETQADRLAKIAPFIGDTVERNAAKDITAILREQALGIKRQVQALQANPSS